LKSRQIGATFFFAREALVDALVSGKNKIFLSASRAQAFQFKQYMIDLAEMVGVELRGDAIRLNNGATLYFLGTNSRTAQGRHGDLYVDEYFWIPDFKELTRLAKPMAAQKQYRITYFSTPSALSHPAYPFWSGEQFNEGRPVSEQVKFAVDHAALAPGRLCEDGQFRQIVTLDDAERMGCTLFDRAQLMRENSPSEFRQLFMCEFVETGDGVFDLASLMRCTVSSWDVWADFYKPLARRPVGDLPVWIGYDPADGGDSAALVAVLPPRFNGDAFRILERHLLRGNDFQEQADFVRGMLSRYRVEKIVIDKTGLGAAVFQLVQGFFPRVLGINYSLPEKALKKLHYAIASLHDLVIAPGSQEENTAALLGAMENPYVTIIGHPDNPVYPIDFDALARAAAAQHILIEANNSSHNPGGSRPGSDLLARDLLAACRRHGAHIIMGSDAHIDIDVGEHGYTHAILEEIDFPADLVLNSDPARLKAWIWERHALNAVHGLDYFS